VKRREFISLLGGGAAAWPLAGRAQQGDRRRVGIFMDLAEQDREGQARVAAFREGMQKLGWIANTIRFAGGGEWSGTKMSDEPLVRRGQVLWGAERARAAQSATNTIQTG
jgi:hypothetical protein